MQETAGFAERPEASLSELVADGRWLLENFLPFGRWWSLSDHT
ncbi:hypothetical protein A2U01_0110733, partial [Trifolium medium]|nr:hypothetical protein [Trifolium medium]